MAESRIAIHGAIGASIAIAITKFVVAGLTGGFRVQAGGTPFWQSACGCAC